MESATAIEVGAILINWGIFGFLIWKWGPGLRKRSVKCPEKNVRARVLADQREAEFGCLKIADVKSCTLLSGEVNCAKECLMKL